jgi:hypothetical protein
MLTSRFSGCLLVRSFLVGLGLVVAQSVTTVAAAQTDVIRGKVTDAQGAPLANVRVTATSIPGNVTREARTDNKGSFQIVFPGGTGDYFMGYASIGFAYRQFEIKRTADQDVLIADARLAPVMLDTVRTEATGTAQRPSRFNPVQDVSGTERYIAMTGLPPESLGDIAAMAASLPGVLLVPGTEGAADGFSVFGLGADQNSTTLNGLPTNSSNLPRDASMSTSLSTSPFDVSRGGFSGGNLNIRSGLGSNYKERGLSLQLNTPQMEWTDRAARDLGAEYTGVSIGGRSAGPITLNKTFYNVSYQLSRNSQRNPTLLNTTPIALNTAGVASDSVTRLMQILGTQSVGGINDIYRTQRLTDNGSLFGSIDISPPTSTSGQTVGLTFTGGWRRTTPEAASITQLPSSAGDRYNWNGGLQGRHSAYVKSILTESSLGFNTQKDYGDAYLDMPSGRVRVSSALANGGTGIAMLGFGGHPGLSSSSRSLSVSGQNTLSWFDDRNRHRVKLTSEFNYAGSSRDQSSNLLGTFTFNSLADLENNRPSSFSRLLTATSRSTGQVTGAVSLGDSYRKSPDTQIQYGIRVDASGFTTAPDYNPAVKAAFGRRNDFTPLPISISPRIGFSKTLGQAQEFAAFMGGFRAPRAVLRGGVGVFTNNPSSFLIGTALDNTGLPSGSQQIACFGTATPIPDWAAYAADPSLIPTECANGTAGTPFANPQPSVTLIAKDFKPQQNIRSNLSWNGSVLDARFNLNVEGTYSYNRNQQRNFDLNFQPNTKFTLASEDNRPVFVSTSSIVPTTGSVAPQEGRLSQSFSRVTEIRSDLNSTSAQLQLRLNPIYRTQTIFTWNGAYTYSHVREQVSGFQSTSSNPLEVLWFRSGQGPHQISYNLSYVFFNAVQVRWNGSFRSGSAFTPTVAADVNGDGYFNDRAFVFDPSGGGDTAVTNGMRRLIDNSSGRTRECLLAQVGEIAARNSCRAPWTQSASMTFALDRAKFRLPARSSVQFSLSNPFGAADLALHGSNNLRGWGSMYSPEQTLLYVRGFDAAAVAGPKFNYEVNQRFGATRPQFVTLRNPVILTATVKYDLGAMRERQLMTQRLDMGRTAAGTRMSEFSLRSMLTSSVPNMMPQILFQQDSLQLSAQQADSIASMNRRYTYRVDSLWSSTVRWFAALPNGYDSDEVWQRYLQARRVQIDMLAQVGPLVADLLTPAQKRKVPSSLLLYTDPRYLRSIRNGSSLFVGTGQFGSGGSGPMVGVPMMIEGGMMTIIR